MCASVRTCVCTVRVRVWVRIYVGGWVDDCGRVWVGRGQASLPKSGHEPQHTAQLLYIPNGCQGWTPLRGLCGSGVAGCVQLLVQQRADTTIEDHRGRGVVQLAQQSQGHSQRLAQWLLNICPADGLPLTKRKSRPPDVKHREAFSYLHRGKTRHIRRKCEGAKGCTPQDWFGRNSSIQWEQLCTPQDWFGRNSSTTWEQLWYDVQYGWPATDGLFLSAAVPVAAT